MARSDRARPRLPARIAFAGALAFAGGCRYLPLPGTSAEPPPPVAVTGPSVDADWSLATDPERSSPVAPPPSSEVRAVATVRLLRLADPTVLPRADVPDWVFAPGSESPLEPVQRYTAEIASGWSAAPLEEGATVLAKEVVPLANDCGWSADARVDGSSGLRLHFWIDGSGTPGAAVSAAGRVPALQLGQAQAAAVGAIDDSLWQQRSGREFAPLPKPGDARVLWSRAPAIGDGAIVLEVHFDAAPATGPQGLAYVRSLADVRAQLAQRRLPEPPAPLLFSASNRPELRRPLAVELARTTGLDLLLDLVLLAPDDVLAEWIAKAVETTDRQAARPAQAFALERAALAGLARRIDAETIDPSLHALLYVHLGALGGEPSIVADVAQRATTAAELESALVNENSLLLDDARAVVRVRAARWLATRGIAPKDFDALAPRDRRRAVLETWRREREAAAAAKPATTATTGAGTTTSTAKDAGAAGGKP